MIGIIDLLIAAGAGMATTSIVTSVKINSIQNKLKKLETAKNATIQPAANTQLKKPRAVKSEPRIKLKNEEEAYHRLRVLEELLSFEGEFGFSTDCMNVKNVRFSEGVKYNFHYMHRPQPFLILSYHENEDRVSPDYVFEEMLCDKARARDIIRRLSEKIREKHSSVKKEKKKEHNDEVLKKADELLGWLDEENNELTREEADKGKEKVQSIIDVYQPLKEETKEQYRPTVIEALSSLEEKLKEKQKKKEAEKTSLLEEIIYGIKED